MVEAVKNLINTRDMPANWHINYHQPFLTKTDPGYSSMEILGFSIKVYIPQSQVAKFFTPDPENQPR